MQSKHTSKMYIVYLLVFLVHVLNVIIFDEKLSQPLGYLAILLLLISFKNAGTLFKVLGFSFILIGAIVMYTEKLPLNELPLMMTSNLSVLALLMMLPWMTSVVQIGRFDKTMTSLIEANAKDLGQLYPRSAFTTFTLASFLNLSAASISQDVLKEHLKQLPDRVKNEFILRTTLRGFTLALLWSPLELLLVVTIFTTGVQYLSLLPWLLVIVVITFVLDSFIGNRSFRKYSYEGDNGKQIDKKNTMKSLIHLICALGLFLAIVVTAGKLFNIDFLIAVTLVILPFTLLWSLFMKRLKSFWKIALPFWISKTNTMQNFVVLFIALSFFSNSLNSSSVLSVIEQPIVHLANYPLLIFIAIQLFFILLSMAGIHPVATIGILTSVISILLTILNPLSVAIVIVTSSVATLTVGSYGLVVTLTSMNLEYSPYKITWSNMPFAIMYGFVGSIVAFLLL
ncbi:MULTISPECIES: hypothetical protein [Sporosarcina]|uniref:hypothetical protein n=1 Tax=Sporosarcina TaxID=1569 RepID=UPI00129B1C24|nr:MULTISPECIES: hypothetical protein [Sporosarcina]GKV66558.1 hypothetical protein NCCP2331_27110 [Sporosarcina sp. NCCP-2331]GLB56835.1 hypothetical protein NCCP2378_26220 [Sporosarcina sp. NCCP-2378]